MGRQFLEREYTAIVAIRDPSVVQIHDYGVHAGYEYLVMEYLPRGDLKARMQQPMNEHETLRYVAQIAAALQVVHHAGLLHRGRAGRGASPRSAASRPEATECHAA